MQLKILYHGNCFDGCASAAIVSRFLAEREGSHVSELRYEPLHHGTGDPFARDAFDGDLNACVDFRFSPNPRLHWWFDHHASAFPTPGDRAAFEADGSGQKFWDPAAPSCAGFAARTLAARFDWRAPDLAELISWADVIDAARFDSPSTAVRLESPALQIMTVLEATQDPAVPTRVIEAMQRRPLGEIAAEPWVAGPFAPLRARHRAAVEAVRRLARQEDGVVRLDLSETDITSPNKFIAYDLPWDDVEQRYGGHFQAVLNDLHETDDLRVLDMNGHRVFNLLRLDQLGEPIVYDRTGEPEKVYMD